MQQPIMTSVAFLSQASAPADPSNDEDRATATDLRDTLAAHRGECVGMAANMIGVAKRIMGLMGSSMALFSMLRSSLEI